LLTKLTLPETTSEEEVSVGAVFVMDSRVSPADGIPKYTVPRAGQKATITELRLTRRSTKWELETP